MSNPHVTQLVSLERVERLIHLACGEKVLLDANLVRRYGVTTGNLNKAVKRNSRRFDIEPPGRPPLTLPEVIAHIWQN